jgi:type IV pilus assembly protein PilB
MAEPLKTAPTQVPSKTANTTPTAANRLPGSGAAAPGTNTAAPMPPISELKGRPLGRVLIKMGRLTREQVHKGLSVQADQRAKGINTPIGQILVDLGLITDKERNLALASQMGYEMFDIGPGRDIPKNVIEQVPPQMAVPNRLIPVDFEPKTKTLKVVFASPDNFRAIDDLRSLLGFNVIPYIGDPENVGKLIAKYYDAHMNNSLAGIWDDAMKDETFKEIEGRGESIDLDTLNDLVNSNPVKKLLNMILLQAIKEKASDIHFEPFEDEFKLRYRIDGVLYEMVPPPKHIALAVTSRIKVMANLDIAERRIPQDGRIPLSVEGKQVDMRVAVLPTIFGESVVMRILDRANVNLDLEKVGLREDDLRVFRQLISKPNGIVLVTGPTGSGKTTTLYAALNELNSIEDKLITTEDPVEYDIDGIIQVQIRPDIDLTFAACLRSILRQDPDIVLVGEIRDKETAVIATQASLTGHLVFSTLHTNDAPSSVARMLDLGVEPFLITATVEGVIAQRLVRRICSHCKEEYQPTEDQLMELELLPDDVKGQTFCRGRGCDYCNNTGYRGRMGIYEIMVFDDEIRDMIMNHGSTNILRDAARKRGMRTLRQSGLMAIYEGLTTIEEVVRQTILEE